MVNGEANLILGESGGESQCDERNSGEPENTHPEHRNGELFVTMVRSRNTVPTRGDEQGSLS